ncbi:MAG TPA: hypothetical protein VFR58_02750 [Flavisolibacter sp.]|nr:hypothetical protein [Flavisolibacter sp.]
MIENLPAYTYMVFALAALATVFCAYRASGFSKPVLFSITGWAILQGIIASTGFYTEVPVRIALAVGPPLAFIVMISFLPGARRYLSMLDLKTLTWLHAVRVPVELVLLWLYFDGLVPRAMTLQGYNFDILAGLSAPFVAWLFLTKKLNRKWLIAWNLVGLGLLFAIVISSILSAPTPIQQLSFDQPNRAVLYFPFVWLPSVIVPLVLLAHVAALRQLMSPAEKKSARHQLEALRSA